MVPVGILVNAAAVFLGGIIGGLLGNKVPESLKESLPIAFGTLSMVIGISAIVKLHSLPVIVLALILGTVIGELCNLDGLVTKGINWLKGHLIKSEDGQNNQAYIECFISVLVLFCASGTGIFGSLNEGMTGEYSILLAKSILDFFTAIIFATTLGCLVAMIFLPQLIFFLSLFFCSTMIIPLTNPAMIADFTACGGIITFAIGFCICNIKEIKVMNMIPALLLVIPLSALWQLFF